MSGLVDWALARRIATRVAGEGEAEPPDGELLRDVCGDAGERVLAYTGMRPATPLPEPHVVARGEWARGALETLRELVGELDRHAAIAVSLPGPLAGAARGLLGAGAAAEAGGVVGLAARRVLGQYEVSLLGPERPPRLVFVWPNLVEAERHLGGERREFLYWIALHEMTHAVQFGAVAWLRPHLGSLIEELVAAGARELDSGRLRSAAGRALRSDPRGVIGALLRGELLRVLAGPEERAVLDRAQAVMSVLEGHAEHVMDAAAAGLGPQFAELRRRLEARREARSGLEALVGRLLGMEMKLRQYRVGKAFCDAVVADGGIEALNRVWTGPEAVPSLGELERPGDWLARVEAQASTVA